MKNIKTGFFILAVLCSAGWSVVAQAGLQLDTTRIIYPEGAKSVTVGVDNVGGNRAFLVESQVSADTQGQVKAPFVVMPPLLRVESGGSNQIRIMQAGESLPKDRESLFWFSVKGIPASAPLSAGSADKGASVDGGISLGVGIFVKMLYRPQGLMPQQAGFAALRVQHTPEGIRLNNPSPYYLNFASLSVGGVSVITPQTAVNSATLAPFASMDISARGLSLPAQVQWKLINDQGAVLTFKGAVL